MRFLARSLPSVGWKSWEDGVSCSSLVPLACPTAVQVRKSGTRLGATKGPLTVRQMARSSDVLPDPFCPASTVQPGCDPSGRGSVRATFRRPERPRLFSSLTRETYMRAGGPLGAACLSPPRYRQNMVEDARYLTMSA